MRVLFAVSCKLSPVNLWSFMDTQLLNAFITVAEKHSFSLAAEELGLTQSAISKRMALLESQVGQMLFDRTGRKIFLTEAGELLLPSARNILTAVENAQQLMEQQHKTVSGTLRLATSHHIGIHRLPAILKSFTQKYPEVHLQLQFIDSEKAIKAIGRNEFDIAVITLPEDTDDYGDSDIQYHNLWQDPMQFVINKSHSLANKTTITLKDLQNYPAILPDRSTRTTQLVQQLFSQKNYDLSLSMTTNHLDAIKMMVSVGLGWSALPERLIDKSLQILPIKKINLSRQLGCIHHRHRTLSNAARAMLKHLKQ